MENAIARYKEKIEEEEVKKAKEADEAAKKKKMEDEVLYAVIKEAAENVVTVR